MKPHIQFSPDEAAGSGSNEPVKRLAERYNIPEKDVEALLYGSRAPKTESVGSTTKEKSMPQDPHNYGSPQKQSGWSTANILSLIVGILGIMALTIILVAVIRNGRHEFPHFGMNVPPPIMHAPTPPPPPMMDTSKNQNPAMNQPQEIPPPVSKNELEPKPTPKNTHRMTRSSSGSGFTTSNSIEAQEHLAELRADGNTKAKIREMKKNGVTIYSVK